MSSFGVALRPVRRRVRMERAAKWGCYGLALGAVLALLMQVAAFLWPIPNALAISGACLAVPTIAGLLAGLCWPVPVRLAARRADQCGLMARVQTALEWEAEEPQPMTRLQREDAHLSLQRLRYWEAMPIRVHRLPLMVAAGCLAILFGLVFVPNPQHETLKAKAGFRQEMQKQAKLVEDGADTLDEKDKTSLETRKILGDLAKELRNADDPRQALTSMDQAERKLEKLRQDSGKNLRDALSAQGLTDVAEALEQEDAEALQKALEEKDANELQKALEKAAESMESAPTAENLTQAAQQAASGNMAQVQASLGAASSSANLSASQASALMQMARTATARAGEPLGSASQGSMPQSLAALGMQSGNGQGQGQRGSGGSGLGAGSGAGTGSTNLDAGYKENSSRQSSGRAGSRSPQEKLGEYEVIYDPTRLGVDGEMTNERGTVGQGETTEVTLGAGLGSVSEGVPYSDVAYEYGESAVQAVEHANLPAYVQKWVEIYFQSLLK